MKYLVSKIIYILYNISALLYLFRSPITKNQKWEIYKNYLVITIKVLLIKSKIIQDKKRITFLNFTVYYKSLSDFYELFCEIFLQNVYFFKSSSKIPYILDCGSNVGLAVIYFKYLYPESEIDCFEPDMSSVHVLEKNVKENNLQNVNLHKIAVSDKKGKAKLFSPSRDGASTISSLYKDSMQQNITDQIIQIDKLSSYIKKKVDFLKVDIEGAETNVFKDLGDSGKIKNIDQTVIEYHLNYYKKSWDLSELLRALEDNKFVYHFHATAVPLYQLNKIQTFLIFARKADLVI